MAAPTFLCRDPAENNSKWLIEISFSNGSPLD